MVKNAAGKEERLAPLLRLLQPQQHQLRLGLARIREQRDGGDLWGYLQDAAPDKQGNGEFGGPVELSQLSQSGGGGQKLSTVLQADGLERLGLPLKWGATAVRKERVL